MMLQKRVIGYILLGGAVLSFLLYLSLPFILSGAAKIISFTLIAYILNKIFMFSALYFLGKEFIIKICQYLPYWIEKYVLKILKVEQTPLKK